MTRLGIRFVLGQLLVCLMATGAMAQTSTSSETKKFQVIAVDGNQLVVKLPEGTRELTVPPDFRFTVDGKSLSVSELKPGMAGTATITTRTTAVPVTVTEVKNGTVRQAVGSTIIVETGGEMKMFTQRDIDKRGVKIMRDGRLAQVSDFRQGDQLTATIITSMPPRMVTEKEVQATLANCKDRGGSCKDVCVPRSDDDNVLDSALVSGVSECSGESERTGATAQNGRIAAYPWDHRTRVASPESRLHRPAAFRETLEAAAQWRAAPSS
jgi:hypothetical protein